MANLQQKKSEALATIDAALSILNKFPQIEQTNTQLSFNTSSNPFPFLLEALKNTAGYNILIRITSNFLVTALPIMEITIKGVLLANIKNLLSCSINPFISDEVLRDGIVFDLEQIDLTDTLKYCPTSNVGQYYYFDNKNSVEYDDGTSSSPGMDENGGIFKTPDELKSSKDFNCLLWFMKNRASFREVWGKKVSLNDAPLEENNDYWNSKKGKCRKGAGIVTLEFNERSQSLKNAEGNGMSVQTPFNNCLHVFIGNTKENDKTKSGKSVSTLEREVVQYAKSIERNKAEIEKLKQQIEELKKNDEKIAKLFKKGKIKTEEYNAKYHGQEKLNDAVKLIEDLQFKRITYDEYESSKNRQHTTKQKDDDKEVTTYYFKEDIRAILTKASRYQEIIDKDLMLKVDLIKQQRNLVLTYRPIKQNYYYRHTLIEFNTDYVMSLRLFDSKVIAAQLIDSLTGLLSFDLNLSYKQRLIRNEVKKMVEMIVETDDTVVDDCFFTFTNDAYNAMLEKAELNQMGLFSVNGEQNTTAIIDAESLLSNLNELNESATQEGSIEVIEHALTTISKELASPVENVKKEVNFGIQMNFIEQLLNNLAYVITSAVLSPKVYLLILINLQLLGKDTNFNLEEFIGKYKQLIATILRSIRDEILKYFVKELKKLLEKISAEVAVKVGIEQMEYYNRLIRRIIDCFKNKRGILDFNIDNVDYADIISEEITPKNKEC